MVYRISSAERILTLIQPSKTGSFINSIKSHGLKVLRIFVEDQVIMPLVVSVNKICLFFLLIYIYNMTLIFLVTLFSEE